MQLTALLELGAIPLVFALRAFVPKAALRSSVAGVAFTAVTMGFAFEVIRDSYVGTPVLHATLRTSALTLQLTRHNMYMKKKTHPHMKFGVFVNFSWNKPLLTSSPPSFFQLPLSFSSSSLTFCRCTAIL